MWVIRTLGLVCLIVLTFGCSGSSTAEDRRRSELLDRDPLFTAELEGVRWETSAVAGPGSGPGPGTYWTVALRSGRLDGDPREVLLKAARTASRFGWVITDAHCFVPDYLANGWKQFDHFVALLSISWVDYPGEDRDRFFLRAETPPVNPGGTNQTPARSREVDLTRSCLVTGQDTSYYGGNGTSSKSPPSPDASAPA
jgi:hypothetical protein